MLKLDWLLGSSSCNSDTHARLFGSGMSTDTANDLLIHTDALLVHEKFDNSYLSCVFFFLMYLCVTWNHVITVLCICIQTSPWRDICIDWLSFWHAIWTVGFQAQINCHDYTMTFESNINLKKPPRPAFKPIMCTKHNHLSLCPKMLLDLSSCFCYHSLIKKKK